MKKTNYLLICCILFLSNCKSDQEKEAIKLIDKQLSYIDSIIEEYKILPIDSLNMAYMNKLNNQSKQIKIELGKNENLTIDDMNTLSTYADYVSGLVDLVHIAEKTAPALFYSKKQLEKLRSDIEHGIIPNDSIIMYVNHELQSFKLMETDIDKVLGLKTIGGFYKNIEIKADSIMAISFPK